MSDRLDPNASNASSPLAPSFSATARRLVLLAALLGASGVALGAYQAHGLQRWLERQVATAGGTISTTEASPTEAPITEAPITEAPITEAPITEAPATEAPATEAPITEAPVKEATGSVATGGGSTVARRLANAETAVRYQLVHAVALLTLALLHPCVGGRGVAWAGGFMIAGLVGFSGGLWQIVATGRPWHWAIVPAGGLLLIVAWLTLAVTVLRRSTSTAPTSTAPTSS